MHPAAWIRPAVGVPTCAPMAARCLCCSCSPTSAPMMRRHGYASVRISMWRKCWRLMAKRGYRLRRLCFQPRCMRASNSVRHWKCRRTVPLAQRTPSLFTRPIAIVDSIPGSWRSQARRYRSGKSSTGPWCSYSPVEEAIRIGLRSSWLTAVEFRHTIRLRSRPSHRRGCRRWEGERLGAFGSGVAGEPSRGCGYLYGRRITRQKVPHPGLHAVHCHGGADRCRVRAASRDTHGPRYQSRAPGRCIT